MNATMPAKRQEMAAQSPRWGFAFALSWLIWLGGTALGIGIVEWAESLPIEARELPDEWLVSEADATAARQTIEEEAALAPMDDFLFILSRNLTVYIWLLAGLLSAGITTFLVLLANGVALGQTIGVATVSGMPKSVVIDLLLTHGILELGAFCIAGTVGFQGFRLALGGSECSWAWIKSMRLGTVLAFGAGALAVAAGIEAVVTADMAARYEAAR